MSNCIYSSLDSSPEKSQKYFQGDNMKTFEISSLILSVVVVLTVQNPLTAFNVHDDNTDHFRGLGGYGGHGGHGFGRINLNLLLKS